MGLGVGIADDAFEGGAERGVMDGVSPGGGGPVDASGVAVEAVGGDGGVLERVGGLRSRVVEELPESGDGGAVEFGEGILRAESA